MLNDGSLSFENGPLPTHGISLTNICKQTTERLESPESSAACVHDESCLGGFSHYSHPGQTPARTPFFTLLEMYSIPLLGLPVEKNGNRNISSVLQTNMLCRDHAVVFSRKNLLRVGSSDDLHQNFLTVGQERLVSALPFVTQKCDSHWYRTAPLSIIICSF